MTTVQNLIDETKRMIFSGEREQMNQLTGAITNAVTSLACNFALGGIAAGAVLSIDQELMYVWSVSSPNVTVQRGYLGSTAAAHTAGAFIYVNPRFPDFSIYQAINQELDDLCSPSAGLYQVKTVELTNVISVTGYDLSMTNYIDVLEVHYRNSTQTKWWSRIDSWRVINNANTTYFPSGRALMLQDLVPVNTAIIRIVYKSAFIHASTTADDLLSVCGLPLTCHDIPALGVAAKLSMLRGIKRNWDDTQGEPRRASEVPPQAIEQSGQALYALRARRIASESARLKALYPARMVN